MIFNSNVPYVTLDKDYNIIFAHEDVNKRYHDLLAPGYFANMLSGYCRSDFARPVLMDTPLLAAINTKLMVVQEDENINCYMIKTESRDMLERQNLVSYQMREPISSIFALLPIIADNINNDNSDKAISYLEEVYSKSYKLLRNVTNISLANKILNSAVTRMSVINLSSVIESIAFSVKAVETDVTINCELDRNVLIKANHSLLVNGILNLISNSINFRRDEPVEISIRLSARKNNATLSYQDNSKGIKSEYQNMVFRPYFSKDPYGDNDVDPELGLGLFIAKSAFTQAGGTVLLTSNFGEGVRYSVSLPIYNGDDTVLESNATDFLLNRYSEVFVQLCESCNLPSLK